MTQTDIASLRLFNQQLLDPQFSSPKELVRHMGAMQAQDFPMAKWAIGCRLPDATEETVEAAVDRGDIVRTHVLRPTWHIVPAQDVKWMLELTAPQIQKAADYMNKHLELTPAIFRKTNKLIEKHLAGTQLTREEIMERVRKAGINVDALRAAHIMFDAELKGLIVNGPMRGKSFTYGLLEERVPKPVTLKKTEALATLARRYFTSHGPATMDDFRWWSGLLSADVKSAMQSVKPEFSSEVIDGKEYWFKPPSHPAVSPSILFLPAYDEFMVGYKDRSASLETKYVRATITVNGIFKPVIVVNGKVIGNWKRLVQKGKLHIETSFFKTAYRVRKYDMKHALEPYAHYQGSEVKL
jgi:hypothetical protein